MTDASLEKCQRCGAPHDMVKCPFVKAVEYRMGGDPKYVVRFEFLTPNDWPKEQRQEPEAPYPKLGQNNG